MSDDLSSEKSEGPKDWSFTSHVGADLRGIDLSGANLRRAVFDGADLEGADLSGADLRKASFKRANLMKAAFDDADMRNASFVKARMNLSNFQRCRLDGADLRGIRGRYAIWRDANWRQLWMTTYVTRLEKSGQNPEWISLKPFLKVLLSSIEELRSSSSHHSYRHIQ